MEKFAPSRALCEKTQRICGVGVKPLDIVYRGLEK